MKSTDSELQTEKSGHTEKEKHWHDILAPISHIVIAVLAFAICLICGYLFHGFTVLKSDVQKVYEEQAPDISGLNVIAANYMGELSLIADEHTRVVYYLNPKTGDITEFYSKSGNACIYDEDDSVLIDAVTKKEFLELEQ